MQVLNFLRAYIDDQAAVGNVKRKAHVLEDPLEDEDMEV